MRSGETSSWTLQKTREKRWNIKLDSKNPWEAVNHKAGLCRKPVRSGEATSWTLKRFSEGRKEGVRNAPARSGFSRPWETAVARSGVDETTRRLLYVKKVTGVRLFHVCLRFFKSFTFFQVSCSSFPRFVFVFFKNVWWKTRPRAAGPLGEKKGGGVELRPRWWPWSRD